VFFIDGQNVLQLTHFGRYDTVVSALSPDGQRVFFGASADPFGTNPTEKCQVFSIDRHGGDLQQLTSFSESSVVSVLGCFPGPRGAGCSINRLGFDPHTGALIFFSSCDPLGTNTDGHQIFAMRPDGSGLRQLTNTHPYTVDAGGAVSVEAAYPFAHPGIQR
jgi:Tol biopolymer transport system component